MKYSFRVKLMDGTVLEFRDLCNKVINMDKRLVTFVHENNNFTTSGLILGCIGTVRSVPAFVFIPPVISQFFRSTFLILSNPSSLGRHPI